MLQKVAQIYICEICDYKTSRKHNYNKHLATRKHKILTNTDKNSQKVATFFCECGRSYKHRQSLHNHKKICQYQNTEKIELPVTDEELSENNKQLNKKLDLCLDIIQNEVIPQMNISGNIYNTNTNTFNLNVFLNETCKDAINMSDFIQNLTVELKDLEFTKKNGVVSGVSNIFVNGLNALEVEKRPIHCTDSKRKTLYIKDENKWEKDNHKMIDESIKKVKKKHTDAIKEWEDQHPNWNDSEKLTQDYLQFVKSVIDNIDESGEKKIIKNISNEVQIKELKE